MPLYVYECLHCQTVFEVRATFKEKEAGLKPECPQCQSKETRQRISAGLLLKGTGHVPAPNCGPNASPGCCG